MVKIAAEEEIKVKWIVGVYYTAFLGVVIYVLVDCIINHRYCDFSPPTGFRSGWVVGDRKWNGPQSESYCTNAFYDWPLTVAQFDLEGPHNLTKVPCAWMENIEIATFIDPSSFAIPTFYERAVPNSSIPAPYFVTALDKLLFNFNHGFQHPSVGTILLPETFVFDIHGNEVKHFPSGQLLSLSYADILKATKVDFDKKTATLPQLGVADSTFRHTGAYVLMTFTYTNYEPNESPEHILCRIYFTVVDNVWGVITTRDGVEHHGMKVVINSQGSVGSFDFFVLGVYILNTVVLLGIADFIARQAYMFEEKVRKMCIEATKDTPTEEELEVPEGGVHVAKGDATPHKGAGYESNTLHEPEDSKL